HSCYPLPFGYLFRDGAGLQKQEGHSAPSCSHRIRHVYGLRTLSTAVLPVPARVAVMVTGFWPPPNCPVKVVTVNVAVLCPACTVTVGGTLAFRVSLLVSVTIRPPAGAAPVNVTVPVEGVGAVTVVGLSASDARAPASWVVAVAVFDFADSLPAPSNAET